MADERPTSRSRNYHDDRYRNRGHKPSRASDYKRDKFERKAPPEFSGKPCHIHGNKANDVSQFSVRYEYLLLARPAKARR